MAARFPEWPARGYLMWNETEDLTDNVGLISSGWMLGATCCRLGGKGGGWET